MLYTIPYNQDFIDVLSQKVLRESMEALVLLPGKYLACKFQMQGVRCLSYDDLWFKNFPKRATNLAESILIDRIINKKINANPLIKGALKKAINEFFYYGIKLEDLVMLNNQHEMLYEVVSDILEEIKANKISLKINSLYEVLDKQTKTENKLKLFFNKPVYAVLPVIFSPLLFKILKLFHEKFKVNLVLYGFDQSLDYDITYDHPQFYMKEFVDNFNKRSLIELKGSKTRHPDEINRALLDVMCPAKMVHLLHKSKLYNFNHIKRFSSESASCELRTIVKVIADYINNSNKKKIAIVSKKTEKVKILYKYLRNSSQLKSLNRGLTIVTSAPTYCSDYEQLKLFFKILDYAGGRKNSIAEIFSILKHPAAKAHYQEIVLPTEKYLLGIEELNPLDLKGIIKILERNHMDGSVKLIDMISKLKGIRSGKSLDFDFKTENLKGLFGRELHKFPSAHLAGFFSIVSDDFLEKDSTTEMLKMLAEVNNYLTPSDDFKDYRIIITDLFNRQVIFSDEKHTTDGPSPVEIELLTAIEARFLSHDFTIICDLKEDLWPPEADDHYFISEQTRRKFGYSKPSNYEIGYSANDFVGIIASSGEVVISELHEKEILDSKIKKNTTESRFLSLLYAYNTIGGFDNSLATEHKHDLDNQDVKILDVATMQVPLEDRPRAFSSTSLEKLMKNPYLYSIEYNLKLKYLPKFFVERAQLPSNKEFGIIIHNVLHKVSNLVANYKSFDDYSRAFLKVTDEVIHHRYGAGSEARMRLWEGKIKNILDYIYDYNLKALNHGVFAIETEKHIAIDACLDDEIDIKLHAYADRIDHTQDCLYLCDYKTGQLPTKNEIISGLKTQLSFEGMIMTIMGSNEKFDLLKDFPELIPTKKIVLRYIRLTGIATTNEIRDVDFDFKGTIKGISEIVKCLYLEVIPYSSTEKYDNYLQAHIMRTLANIEHKF